MTSTIVYEGDLRTELTHLQSGTVIENDAPTDNQGKGERFSPTDLLATSYGSCMITTMAIRAADMKLAFENTKIEIIATCASPRNHQKGYKRLGKAWLDALMPSYDPAPDKISP